MKSIGIITLFIFFWCGGQAFSQSKSFTPEWAFGVNGGATFSKMSFNSIFYRIPQDLLNQYSGGISVRYISENHFGILGELNYSLRGWKERQDSTVNVNRYTRSLAYIELPLMTHIYFNLGKRVRFIFNLGPQIGYYLSAKEIEKDIIVPPDPDYYNNSVQNSFDYGLKGALGLEFRTGAGSFILDGRYYYGLSDIFNNSKGEPFQSSHNQVMGVNLTYLFRMKKK